MAGANKHKQRSKRSHFNGIPRYMFAIRAAEKKNMKENREAFSKAIADATGVKE